MMAHYISQFRELYEELLGDECADIPLFLQDWALRHAEILQPLAQLRRFNAPDNFYEVERDDLESLYALSRICDTLLLPFQSGECWFDLSRAQSTGFWGKLGIEAREPREFHPFWCEIVACENGEDEDAPPQIEEIFWPALTWGELLICRAGVRVCAGRNWMRCDVAAVAPLYFASRRNYRITHDLSHGWGSNSQWTTAFRRDYIWNEHYVFNADGAYNFGEPSLQNLSAHEWLELATSDKPRRFFAASPGDDYGLNLAEREELLVNRCWMKSIKNDDEFWPYDDVAVWKQAATIQV